MLNLVYADKDGRLYDHPEIHMVGRSGGDFVDPQGEELIPLPAGATLTMLPGCAPVGVSPRGKLLRMKSLPAKVGKGAAFAVGALLPQGYTRTLLPGYQKMDGDSILPLLGYTAVGFKQGKFWVAAVQTDEPERWNPEVFNSGDLQRLVDKKLAQFPENRILRQLSRCALDYCCLTAQNIFYQRWEGGIPVSPQCNAHCLGCISLQPAECCPSPQQRIGFVPRVSEVVEIGVSHLQAAEGGIISFGQGCEGEPSLQAETIATAIREIRQVTEAGTINMNTNAGYTAGIQKVVDAGIDALRVSIISALPETYNAYYRPSGYTLDNVVDSISYATNKGVYVSLNLLAFPGLMDRPEEAEALVKLVREAGVNMLQLRNLNIDPDWFLAQVPKQQGEEWGMLDLIKYFKAELPQVEIGNFSRPIKQNSGR